MLSSRPLCQVYDGLWSNKLSLMNRLKEHVFKHLKEMYKDFVAITSPPFGDVDRLEGERHPSAVVCCRF